MQRKSWAKFDLWLLFLALALACFGFLVIRSATLLADQQVSRQLITQAAFAGVGLMALFAIAALDYRVLGTLAIPLYFGTIAILGAVLVAGKTIYGAQRWIAVGPVQFQPSELAKFAVIVCLARYLSGREEKGFGLKTLVGSLLIVLVPVALVYRQPDLGTSLVLMAIWFGMVFIAGAPLKWLGGLLAVPFVAFPLVWRVMHDYMRRRLTIFLAPERDPFGEGYNMIQARISVGSGGWWGRGLGNGTQTQLNFLKVQQSDFIFAVLAEELGFFGAAILLGLFGAVFFRCLLIGQRSRDSFGRLLAAGVTSMLLFQVFINIGMNIGLAPVTGIPLPFISAGGSSLLTVFISLGVLQSVLIHAQARRYDTQPNVSVPATIRIRRERFPLRWVGGRIGRSVAARRLQRLTRPGAHR
ncbi:MAG TPA: rod shape-determining protein RodA [Chloroflexota bacterium]|nr:rod shape-determining protein RodA [Chloroflexota bacterium]